MIGVAVWLTAMAAATPLSEVRMIFKGTGQVEPTPFQSAARPSPPITLQRRAQPGD